MARTKTYSNKRNIVKALNAIETVSYPLKRQLIDMGYVTARKDADAKKPGRGRMPLAYEISPKGKNLVRLSANWF